MQVDISIVGAGAGGLAAAASLLKQNPKLSISVFDPAEEHYYQPGCPETSACCRPEHQTVHGP